MKDNIVFSQQLENIQLEYLTGGFCKMLAFMGQHYNKPLLQ